MKTKVAFVVAVVLAILSIALYVHLNNVKDEAAKQHQQDVDAIILNSNRLSATTISLGDEKQKSLSLEKDVAERNERLAKLSNDLSQTSESLSSTQNELKMSKEETAKRDSRISELESKNDALDKQAVDLKTSITGLEGMIADTQKKLAASEGDKAFLTKELSRLMAEKADLEKKFNDLAVLREQVRNLKEELSVSRRLDWIRKGIFASSEEHGAAKLMRLSSQKTTNAPTAAATNAPALNVEVNTDGSVKILAPITNSAPPAK